MNGLLAHRERQQLEARLRAAAAGDGAKPLRRPIHSSASSLPSYGSWAKGGLGRGGAGASPEGSSPAGSSPAGALSPPSCASPLAGLGRPPAFA